MPYDMDHSPRDSGRASSSNQQRRSSDDPLSARTDQVRGLHSIHTPQHRRKAAEEVIWPTPADYINDNPVALPCLKKERCGRICETSVLCKRLGQVGPRWCNRNRGFVMCGTAFFTFMLMILMIVPLIALTSDADTAQTFSWANGTAQWDLVVPVQWSDAFSLTIGGMTNSSRQGGGVYYYRYNTAGCEDVLGEACAACAGATTAACIILFMNLIVAGLCFCLDLQRIFHFYDMNCVKGSAILLHLLVGMALSIAPLIIFLGGCYGKLPAVARNKAKNIGMRFEWQLSLGCAMMITVLVLRPIPAIIHMFVPTPEWANGRKIPFRWLERLGITNQPSPDGRYAMNDEAQPITSDNQDTEMAFTDIRKRVESVPTAEVAYRPHNQNGSVAGQHTVN